MDKTLLTVLGIVVLIAIGGGIIYSMNKGESGIVATSTPPIVNNNNNTNTGTVPTAGTPVALTNSVVSASDTTAIVNGSVNPKGAFTSYWYEYGTGTGLGSKTANQTMGSGFVSIQAPGYIVNLVKNTTYYFRLVTENQYGKVAGTQYSFKTTNGTPAPVGSSPTSKTNSATGISRTTANINGEVTPNKANTQYWFEYGKTAELGNTTAFTNSTDNTTKTAVSVSLSDLDPLITYYFRLNAQNQFGTTNGSILNFKTLGPAVATAPKVVSQNATSITTTSARLNGTVNPNGDETEYWFEYSTDTLLGSVLMTATPEVSVGSGLNTVSVKVDIINLAPKTTHYFRLVAQNKLGMIRGSEITFKTK